ncbi:Uncharacterised protein [Sphingobacterium spiritivorum]|uniref:Zinc-finger domain-containing protein n=1 Tax=Sphingobacterium spiritivorum TaxID=258 RepID=A0A380BMF4_SPHSI|nr:hypothetical protein [Sphingobacterium spiritivorum]SUJ02743.1 Uncharacterised protein [Sphingobacterium spiritivorum]
MLDKIIHTIILPCSQATLLVEKRLHMDIPVWKKIQLSVHLKSCKSCHIYSKKASFIEDAIAHYIEQHEGDAKKYFTDNKDFIEKVKQNIKK